MAWLDWRLMLIVLALVPAVVAIVFLYQRLSAPAVTRLHGFVQERCEDGGREHQHRYPRGAQQRREGRQG